MGEEKCCYNKSQLNYFRVCHLAANVLPSVLRDIVIRQWNLKYGLQYGTWKNEVKNGQDFASLETPGQRKRNKELWNIMIQGNVEQWDCTKLFYAILFTTSIGGSLDPKIRKHVNNLREFRNESFAHVSQGEVSSSDFQKVVNKVLQALLGLGVLTSEVKRIQNQESFSTEEVFELQERLERERHSQEQVDLRLGNLEGRVTCLETRVEITTSACNATVGSSTMSLENENTNKCTTPPFIELPARPCHPVIRRQYIDAALSSLIDLNTKHVDSVTAAYIAGGTGSGKTESARQLGMALSEKKSFVMTLDACSFSRFAVSLKKLAVRLGFLDGTLPCLHQASVVSQIEIFSLFIKEKLVDVPSWLLIVDGLSEETIQAQEYLPQAGEHGNGQIIFTTADKSVVEDNPYTLCVFLSNRLSSDEAFQLLSAIAGPLHPVTAATVSEKLGYQAMFLVSAANQVKKLSVKYGKSAGEMWKEFLESLKNRHKDEELPYYLAALTKTTRSNLESVMQLLTKRSPIYKECFHLLVLAKGAALPFSSVTRFLSYQLNLSQEEVDYLLRGCPIQVISSKGSHDFVEVNGVIYKLLCDIFISSVRTEEMVQRLRCICHFAVKNAHDVSVCRVFKLVTPKILQYLSLLDLRFPENAEQRSLHHELGKAFICVLVDYPSAVQCFMKAMAIFESADDKTHPEYARLLCSLGNVFRLTGSSDEACKYLSKSLRLLNISSTTGLQNEDIASCLSSLGLVYQSQGDLDRARELHHRALAIREQIHGDEHIATATSLNNIGGVYHERGDLGMARDYYWKALEIKGRNYGWDFPHVANSFNNIAEISHEQGDLCGAVAMHKRALKIRQRLYGEEHPDIANSFNNIGVIYHKLRELSPARKYHVKALEIRKKVYGHEHVEVASSLNNLGEVYYDEGDLAAAEKCHTQALTFARQHHSVTSSNQHVITSLLNLIRVYVADQEMSTATAYAYEVCKISQKVYGTKDRRTVNAFRRLTELSKRESQGHMYDTSFNIYERVERLSSL